jgi:hypothetical protein
MGLAGIALVMLSGWATDYTPWTGPRDPVSKQRFIPLELWTGNPWNGKQEIRLHETDRRFGKNKNKRIYGPLTWVHPETGKKYLVYERIIKRKSGIKRQLYTINADLSGLGRIFDSRPEKGVRLFEGEVIFPLGYWREGEKRSFQYVEYTKKGPVTREATIKIKRIDFVYNGISHSMEYEWMMRNGSGEILYHENFVYSPGKGLVGFKNMMCSTLKQQVRQLNGLIEFRLGKLSFTLPEGRFKDISKHPRKKVSIFDKKDLAHIRVRTTRKGLQEFSDWLLPRYWKGRPHQIMEEEITPIRLPHHPQVKAEKAEYVIQIFGGKYEQELRLRRITLLIIYPEKTNYVIEIKNKIYGKHDDVLEMLLNSIELA